MALVKTSDRNLTLCLDSKDLNRTIHRNVVSRTTDEILPDMVQSILISLVDAISGYWHILLDLESNLLTTFNIQWSKFR